MRKQGVIVVVCALIALSFYSGVRYAGLSGSKSGAAGRTILYYVDPMHPSYKSDKPGIAPDCGMKLEPVYADSGGQSDNDDGLAALPPGAVQISPDRQQLIGVRLVKAEKKAAVHSLRVLGRVAVDETRLYWINATIDGWITAAGSAATGSFVRKNETLASFYSPEFLSAGQALLYALNSQDRVASTDNDTPGRAAQLEQYKVNLKQYIDSLRNLGMGELQIEEMIRTRRFMETITITAPADGFIVARTVSNGQRFEKGKELFRIADLSRVWILADVYENETHYVKPGATVRATLPNQKRVFSARVGSALPQFDPVSRTLKVRLEADNPGYFLKPDMFVDIELPVTLPPSVVVPADAVLDSGMRKIVYVHTGKGYFEPRMVGVGWRMGSQVGISSGLAPGEEIVVSGNFLIDSESRMKAAAAGIFGISAKDPVCGMHVDETRAKATGKQNFYGGTTYVFCSPECKGEFDKNPSKYAAPEESGSAAAVRSSPDRGHD